MQYTDNEGCGRFDMIEPRRFSDRISQKLGCVVNRRCFQRLCEKIIKVLEKGKRAYFIFLPSICLPF
jgi:hypothetical protein